MSNSDNIHPTFAAILALVAPLAATPVTMETADGFLVVSRERQPKSVLPPYAYDYYYDHFLHVETATGFYDEIKRGEYNHTREAIAIVPCKRGVPLGAKVIL